MTDNVLQVAFNLLMALVLTAYLRSSVRSRAAVGLWWDFLRDQEPIRYWSQLALVALAILESLWTIIRLTVGT